MAGWCGPAGVDVIRSRSPRRPTCRHCSLVRARATIHDASLPSFLCCHNQSETTRSAATASRGAAGEAKDARPRQTSPNYLVCLAHQSKRPSCPVFPGYRKTLQCLFLACPIYKLGLLPCSWS
jgi:hypothetical protein